MTNVLLKRDVIPQSGWYIHTSVKQQDTFKSVYIFLFAYLICAFQILLQKKKSTLLAMWAFTSRQSRVTNDKV